MAAPVSVCMGLRNTTFVLSQPTSFLSTLSRSGHLLTPVEKVCVTPRVCEATLQSSARTLPERRAFCEVSPRQRDPEALAAQCCGLCSLQA